MRPKFEDLVSAAKVLNDAKRQVLEGPTLDGDSDATDIESDTAA